MPARPQRAELSERLYAVLRKLTAFAGTLQR